MWGKKFGASGETRTPTVLLPADFESAASTNSATEACCVFVALLNFGISKMSKYEL